MAEQAGNSDLILENREKLTVTGVRRVLQCNRSEEHTSELQSLE